MGLWVKAELEGDKRLIKKLNRLAGPVANEAVKEGLLAGAWPVYHSARSAIPVSSGELRESITIRYAKPRKGMPAAVFIGPSFKGLVGSSQSTYYGHMVEYGTSRMPAQPYMRPAMDRNRQRSVEALRREIKKRVDRHWGR